MQVILYEFIQNPWEEKRICKYFDNIVTLVFTVSTVIPRTMYCTYGDLHCNNISYTVHTIEPLYVALLTLYKTLCTL